MVCVDSKSQKSAGLIEEISNKKEKKNMVVRVKHSTRKIKTKTGTKRISVKSHTRKSPKKRR